MTTTRIQIRRGTAAEWTSENPVLADGEPGYERNTKRVKIGDGSTRWVSLPYVDDQSVAALAATRGAASGLASLDSGSTVPDGQIPAGISRDTEVTAAIAATASGLTSPGRSLALSIIFGS